MSQIDDLQAFDVDLDEDSGEANGAAYLVHMLLTQQASADRSGRFAREARRLRPVRLSLCDTNEECSVSTAPNGLRVTDRTEGRHATWVRAESRHVLDVTQLRLLGRALIIGPLGDGTFWRLLRDIALRRVVIKGLIFHYLNTMRFLWLVNVRRPT